MSLINACGLTKSYGVGAATVTAVADLTFQVDPGEFVVIMGESGSGKSTLLSLLGGLTTPTAGSYLVDDIEVFSLDSERRADFRREYIGFVFQNFHLVPYLTLLENVMLPLSIVPGANGDKRERALAVLDSVGLAAKASRLPGQVSGGEQERAAIARAIVNNPPILLADEPTGNLDTATSTDVMQVFHRLNREGMTILMVTHSEKCARWGQRRLRLADGRLLD